MFWPEGAGKDLHLKGRARDLLTPAEGRPEVLRSADLYAVTSREREIMRIEGQPAPPELQNLVGSRAGGNLRKKIAQELPGEAESGSPMHLLLDDMAGSTLIAGFAFIRWVDHLPEFRTRMESGPRPYMQDICSGFRPGSVALFADGTLSGKPQNTAHPASLNDVDDPWSWHELDEHPDLAMRRSRRIDIWHDDQDGLLHIDAMFRDSCWDPDGQESVVHEYQMLGSADRATGTLLSVSAEPRPALQRMHRRRTQRGLDERHRTSGDAPGSAEPAEVRRLLYPSQRRSSLVGRGSDPGGVAPERLTVI